MISKISAAGLEFPGNQPLPSQNKLALEISNSNLAGKIDGELSRQESPLIKTVERTERSSFYDEIKQLQQALELISKKIARGESLTSEEERFIAEKSVHLKHQADKARDAAAKIKASLEMDKTAVLQLEQYTNLDATQRQIREMEQRVTEILEGQL